MTPLPDEDSARSRSSWTERNPHYRKHGWAKQGTRYDDQPWPMTAKVLLGIIAGLALWCWISR